MVGSRICPEMENALVYEAVTSPGIELARLGCRLESLGFRAAMFGSRATLIARREEVLLTAKVPNRLTLSRVASEEEASSIFRMVFEGWDGS